MDNLSGYLISFLLGFAAAFLIMKMIRGSSTGKDAQENNTHNDVLIPASVQGEGQIPAPLAAAITAAVYEYRKENN